MDSVRLLWRIWIAVSAVWIMAVGLTVAVYPKTIDLYPTPDGGTTREPWKISWQSEDRLRCSDARTNDASLGDPRSCFSPDTPDRKVFDVTKNTRAFVEGGVLPPVLILIAGVAIGWYRARYEAGAG